jgi:hypothetical protein
MSQRACLLTPQSRRSRPMLFPWSAYSEPPGGSGMVAVRLRLQARLIAHAETNNGRQTLLPSQGTATRHRWLRPSGRYGCYGTSFARQRRVSPLGVIWIAVSSPTLAARRSKDAGPLAIRHGCLALRGIIALFCANVSLLVTREGGSRCAVGNA